jgi:hypothetical protein
MFFPGEKHKTRKGEEVEIVVHFQSGKYPILAKLAGGKTRQYTHDGRFIVGQESQEDIVVE